MLERLSSSARDLGARLHSTGPSISLPKRGPRRPRGDRRVITGLDIEPGHLIVARASVNGRLAVERAAGLPLAPGVVRDGEVGDFDALVNALRSLFEQHDFDRRVRVGIANQRAVVRTLELPPIADRGELEAAVRFQAQDAIPMPLDDVVLDFQDVGVVESEAGPRQRVVLVAARRDMVERLLDALGAAGLRTEGVDLAAFALLRGLAPLSAQTDGRVLYMSMAGLTNLIVAEGGVCVFTRPLSTGLEAIAARVAERLGVAVERARQLVHGIGLAQEDTDQPGAPDTRDAGPAAPEAAAPEDETGPPEAPTLAPVQDEPRAEPEGAGGEAADPQTEPDQTPAETDPAQPAPEQLLPAPEAATTQPPQAKADPERQVVEAAIAEGLRQIAAETRNSLDYHASLGGGAQVERIVLCGPAVDVPGVPAYLQQALGTPLEVNRATEAQPGAAGGLPASCLSVAAGLSVSEVGP